MKSSANALLLLIVFGAPATNARAQTSAVNALPLAPDINAPLTLEQSIRIALANNGQTGAQALQARGAREGITSAKAAGLPQVTGNIGYNYFNQRTSVFVPNFGTGGFGNGGVGNGGFGNGGFGNGGLGNGGFGNGGLGNGGFGGGNVPVVTGSNGIQGFTSSTTTTNIAVSQNIFDGGRTRQLIRGARASSQNAVGAFGGARGGLAFTVAQRFYEQLRQQKLVEQFGAQVELAVQQVEQVRAQIEVGTVARVDILSVQVTLRQRQFDLVTARNNLAQARVNFRNALGLESGPALGLVESERVAQVAGVPQVPTAPETLQPKDLQPGIAVPPLSELPTTGLLTVAPPEVPALEPLENYKVQARALRPDLVQTRAAVAQGETSLALANIENRPQVAASAGFNVDPRSRDERRFQFGVGLSVPIFNGGALSANKRAAADQLAANRLTLAQAKKDADAEVEASYLDIAGQVERIANARVLVEQAQLNLETATERYRLGLGIVLDVTNAQTQLFSAQVSATQSVYDYEIARAALDRAVGRFAWADPGTPPPLVAPVIVPVELVNAS